MDSQLTVRPDNMILEIDNLTLQIGTEDRRVWWLYVHGCTDLDRVFGEEFTIHNLPNLYPDFMHNEELAPGVIGMPKAIFDLEKFRQLHGDNCALINDKAAPLFDDGEADEVYTHRNGGSRPPGLIGWYWVEYNGYQRGTAPLYWDGSKWELSEGETPPHARVRIFGPLRVPTPLPVV